MFNSSKNKNHNPIINVIDAMMGQGKSTWLIRNINKLMGSAFDGKPSPKVIIVTPYLEEITRFKEACQTADFMSPQRYGMSKTENLHELLEAGCNIVTTHALWKGINRTTYELVSQNQYLLFIDEMMDCIEQSKVISNSDFKMLSKQKLISIDDDGRIVWNHKSEPQYKGKFDKEKSMCENGNLYFHNNKTIFWMFPTDFLAAFEEVWVLTYLWSGSIMDAYVRASSYAICHHTLLDYKLVTYTSVDEGPMRAKVRALITIVDDSKLNSIGGMPRFGKRVYPLSSSWYSRQDTKSLRGIKNHTYNYFKNRVKGPANLSMWTCYQTDRAALKGAGYAKGFVSCNARATNEYRHKTNLAYMIDRHMIPIIKTFIESKGVNVDQDQYSLSELIQWIFRSAIRDGKPITLYIPSERMRGLLVDWLNPKPAELAMAS